MQTKDKLLKFLGCEDFELETFKVLLGYPEGVSVVTLSRQTGTTRPTLYGHLDSLIKKGLVKRYSKEKSSLYSAQSMEILMEMYKERLSEYEKNKSELKNLLEKNKTKNHIPRFSVHEGMGSPNPILLDILRSGEKNMFSVWPIEIMLKVIKPSEYEYFHSERIKRGIHLKVLWSKNTKVDLKKHPFLSPQYDNLREIRILPKEMEPTTGYNIYGQKVSVVSNTNESFGFIVDSPEFAKTLKNQFDYMWSKSKKYSQN